MRFVSATALLLLVTSAAAADPVATSVKGTVGAFDSTPREFQLQSAIGATHSGWSVRGDLLASSRRFGEPPGESAAGIALGAPLTHGLSVEGLAIDHFTTAGTGARQLLAGGRLIFASPGSHVWAGYTNTLSARVAPASGPVLQSGGDMAIGRLAVFGSLAWSTTNWHVTIPGPRIYAGDTLVPPVIPDREETRQSVNNTVRLGTAWSATQWSVETTGGARWSAPLPDARWLHVEGAWWFRPRLALRLGLGREVADPAQVGPARGTSLALEWTGPRWETPASPAKAPRAVTLRVVTIAGDLRRIEVTAPGAQQVEAMGDFTMWESVALQRSSGGRFAFELHLAPGVYRVQVRSDGGSWMTPANLPGMDDPDLGEAGTLVIE